VKGFISYISPNLNGSGWNLDYKWRVKVRTHKKLGKIARGIPPKDAKMGFVFFCNQYNADFRPLILHRFLAFLKYWKQTYVKQPSQEKYHVISNKYHLTTTSLVVTKHRNQNISVANIPLYLYYNHDNWKITYWVKPWLHVKNDKLYMQ